MVIANAISEKIKNIMLYDYVIALLIQLNDLGIYPEEITHLDHLTFYWNNGSITMELPSNGRYISIIRND